MAACPRGAPARPLRWTRWWPPPAALVGALVPLMCGVALAAEEAAPASRGPRAQGSGGGARRADDEPPRRGPAAEACSFEQTTFPLRGFSDHEVEFGGVKRRYLLYVPRNQGDPTERLPLLILAPDDGLSPQEQVHMAGLVGEAEKGSFAFVALEGLHTESGVTVDAAAYAETVLSQAFRLLCLDAGRVSCTGFGAGGRFCAAAASELRGAVAAIAPVAGLSYPEPNNAGDPVSVLAFHGLKDPVHPFEGQEGLPSIPDAAEAWAKFNKCTGMEEEGLQDGVTIVRHTGCRQGTAVVVVRADEGGHTWPGSVFKFVHGSGRVVTGFSATTMIAEFLQQLPQRAPLSGRDWEPAGATPAALVVGKLVGWTLLGALAGAVGFYALVVARRLTLRAGGDVASLDDVSSKGGYHSVPAVAGFLERLGRAVSPERGTAFAVAEGGSPLAPRAAEQDTAAAGLGGPGQGGEALPAAAPDLWVQRRDNTGGSAVSFSPRGFKLFSARRQRRDAAGPAAASPPGAPNSGVQFESASEWLSTPPGGQWKPGRSGEVKVW